MAIEFTAMEIFHHALRRDLVALNADFEPGKWKNFAFQLHFHHSGEDRLLWPIVRAKVTDPDDEKLLAAMEAEHERIDPLLAEVKDAVAAGHGVEGPLAELSAALLEHLEHEENAVLPLIDRLLTPAEWAAYVDSVREQDGDMRQNPATFLPWLIEGAPAELKGRVVAAIPPHVRALIS
jgi:hypothetical protein